MIVDSQREYIKVNKFYQVKSCTTTYNVKLYIFICRMDAQNLKLTVTAFTTVVLSILAWVLPFYVYLKIYATVIKHALKLILFERILFQFASKKLATYFSGILESRKSYSTDCILSFRYKFHLQLIHFMIIWIFMFTYHTSLILFLLIVMIAYLIYILFSFSE